ncbi:MAG: hypothetical protein IJN93_07765 [Clostridia bacterium]|nr:hypothetical protein [Clostridia bacterium]
MKKVLNCIKYVLLRLIPMLYLLFCLFFLVRGFNRLEDFNFCLYLDTFAFALCIIFLGIASMLRVFNATIKLSDVCKYFAGIMAVIYILSDILNTITRIKASYNYENTLNFFDSYVPLQETFYIFGFLIIIVACFLKDRCFKTKLILTILCGLCFFVGLNTKLFWLSNVAKIYDIRFIINQFITVYPFVVIVILGLIPSKTT